jgi:hypothetical protein
MDRLGMPPMAFGPSLMASDLARQTNFNTKFARAQDADFLLRALLGKRYAIICSPLYAYQEQGCMPMAKVIPSLSYCCQMFGQYTDKYPVRSRALIATSRLKKLAYYTADATGLWHTFIKRRSRPPTVSEKQQHGDAYELILANCARLFATDVNDGRPEPNNPSSQISN